VTEEARLEFDKVTVSYNSHPALQDISFQVPHGAQVAVVGANGSGKSTLFKALVGLLPVRSGRILIHGQPLGSHHDCVAYVPQREDVEWKFPVSVEDVVMMGRFRRQGWLKRPSQQDRHVVSGCLVQMGIAPLAKRSIGDLSGGQQQRAFLARALAQEPHILLMDEPFTGVDIATQEATLELLTQLKSQQVTIMISTHDLSLATRYFDLVLLLHRRVVAFGVPSEVLNTQSLSEAFGGQVLVLENGAVVVDDCCKSVDEM
jgi:ABC-type Mn2+/Zn2+ transport system ATPase subunit